MSVGSTESEDVPSVYEYRLIYSWQLVGQVFVAICLGAAVFWGPWSPPLPIRGAVALLLLSSACIADVIMRVRSPWRFAIQGDDVTTTSWRDKTLRWKRDGLRLRPPTVVSALEGVTIVETVPEGRLAFRVYRGVVNYRELLQAIARRAA